MTENFLTAKRNQKLKIILASQSPRRAEILKNAGFEFVSFPVNISEIPNENLSLDDQIIDIARRKSRACLVELEKQKISEGLVLSSDTMVCLDERPIGKPESEQDAFNTLKKLSGRTHLVKTSLVVFDLQKKQEVSHLETTEVIFKSLTDDQIRAYIQTGEPLDKAGSYAIQGLGAAFVEKFVGDYDNVVGLPLKAFKKIYDELCETHISVLETVTNSLKPSQNLIAVSKLQPIEKIEKLLRQGQKAFGENYIQEALEKIEYFKKHEAGSQIEWHLIGALQKNKVKYLRNNFSYIHSVDSVELAELIDKKAGAINYQQKIFLQVNVADEKTKAGFNLDNLKNHFNHLQSLKHLQVVGLMTMPPLQNKAEDNRIYFKQIFELGQQLGLKQFSMGTSHDYKVALEEGATWIRLGTVLFGERQKLK